MSGNYKSSGAAQALPTTTGIGLPLNVRMGILAALVGIAILLLASAIDSEMGQFWAFGLAFGFVLQRSRFCFASAFRDIFLLRHSRSLQAVILGLIVATIGFAVLMARQVPNTNLPILPPTANVLPIGLHTIVGGLTFGVGMVVAGGCVSGTIYRMGEGYIASWVSLGGIMIGLLGASFTWNWWWDNHISSGAQIWLPHYFGHGGAVAVTIVGLIGVYLLALWWESRGGIVLPEAPFHANDDESFRAKVGNLWRRVFVHGWPILIGGAVLGFLNVTMFVASHPWGFTGEVSRWVIGLTNFAGIGPGTLNGASSLPGCALDMGETGILHHMLFLVWGMVFGSFVAALLSGEFKIRLPRQKTRYYQAVGGGAVMGYGAGIAMGCTIGAFFSSIPSLGLNGWVFALFLAIGAWVGTQIIQRIE
ncbi:MAG: YeeE/YedE family protein [Litorilinea sp.]